MIDNDVITRIHNIYHSCTAEEQQYLLKILREISETGDSPTYRDIWLADYREIPVDIGTFICDSQFLGKVNRNGDAVYPFWKTTLNEIFSAGNKYQEIFFTGATRIGKSSTAIVGTAYMLYRLMCLKDPQKFFNKKDVSKFSVLFFNITKDLASGVAFREFNDTIAASPWFMNHGKLSKSEKNFYYIPEGGKIDIDYGSSATHGLGKQVFVGFCITGDTEILTDAGYTRIDAVSGSVQNIAQYCETGIRYEPAIILKTSDSCMLVEIETSNGGIVKGTPEHRMLTYNGTYKSLETLEIGDTLLGYSVDAQEYYPTEVTRKTITYHADSAVPVYDVINACPFHNFLIRCQTSNMCLVSHNCDEINFARTGIKDVSKAKQNMQDLYNTISARVKGTFRQNGQVYGKIFAVSSKKSDSDFMEAYIEQQMSAGAKDHMYVADAPQWEVLPPSMFSKGKFHIAVGDRYKKGFIVSENEDVNPSVFDELRAQGYNIMSPPIDMLPEFKADFEIALRDLAGISIPGSLSFITQESLTACINTDRQNPFYQDIMQIGTKDSFVIEDYFHMDEVPAVCKRMPMFIHLDLSLTTDRTGISGVCITGRKDIEGGDNNVVSQPMFTHVFSLALEAPRGDKIPYAKITEFICWLRQQGFNISRVSRDQFQSEYLAQLLEAQGFDVDKISLDRTPDGYMAGRSIILEQRVDMLDCKLLQDELVHLQRDSLTGAIDHIVGQSKDVSDSFVGAMWNGMLNNPGVPVATKTVSSAIAAVNKPRSNNSASLPGMFPGITRYN